MFGAGPRTAPGGRTELAVHDAAEATGLFDPRDIKVRVRTYGDSTVARGTSDFIHVFAYVMEGRSVAQRAALSRRIVGELPRLCPEVPVISMSVPKFEKATYCNRHTM
jgi:5-carboxymethyl-2-hydroxymuconate isomerase